MTALRVPAAGRPAALADPRVETLVVWAQARDTRLDARGRAALDALADAPPRADGAPALALAAAAAYRRVPLRGPRDLQAGHAIVAVLGRLGEPGAAELVRLRERVYYHHPARTIDATLARLARDLRIPLGELEDAFGGPALDGDLTLALAVGPFRAIVRVGEDLRRVRTTWTGASGRPLARRPARAADHPDALAAVDAERRRLQAHLGDLRARLDDAMRTGRTWDVERWAVRMFGDPLRAALARRLVWRFDVGGERVVALPAHGGMRDARGARVHPPPDATVALWHPADAPAEARSAWRRRAVALGLDQPIDQISRDVTSATGALLAVAYGVRVEQHAFRGFLMRRGWNVPYLGRWFAVPEATRPLLPGGPVAVLHLEDGTDDAGRVTIGPLAFRSVHGRDLDARTLPRPLVSDAARDVRGAVSSVMRR